jgi:thiol:disulfide interchange protein DsbD
MVDFYADWCVCVHSRWSTSRSRSRSAGRREDRLLLQADVTKNDDEDKALYVHFGIVGPPTIAFYGADGAERRNFRVVGFMKAAEFAAVVRQAVAPAAQPAQ